MRIRGIFFDAAGVLYTRAEPTRHFVARLLKERALSTDLTAENVARQKVLRSQANAGRASADEYWSQMLEMYGVAGAGEREALVAEIDAFADRVMPMPGVQETLAGLKARGFVLGVITDTMHPLARKLRWLEAVGVAKFVDILACSSELGMHKPAPAIYVHAVAQAGLTPGEAAFVGHAADELDGARRAGLAAVAVHHDPGARADYYAQSLIDLLAVPIFAGVEG